MRKYLAELTVLQKVLGVSFSDTSLLEQALIHSSYCNENPGFAPESNERLEFLGDAVLGFIVAEKLYQEYPDLPEGEMTKFRSALVRGETLASVAKSIGLGDYLYLGKGEEASGGNSKQANLESALEAVIAAVFLSLGLDVVRKLILRLLDKELLAVTMRGNEVNYKSQLQECLQSGKQLPPAYRLIESTGPDHDRVFTAEVVAGDIVLGRGSGKSKKMAETEAARIALEQLNIDFTQ